MNFSYSAFLSRDPDTGADAIIFRPEVPLRIFGAAASAVYMALVDTGADNTILPLSLARELGIVTHKAKGPGATAFGGHQVPLEYADIYLEIPDEPIGLRWQARVHFFDFPDAESETLVVGHQGFLDFFTAVFDGAQMMLDLDFNEDMPVVDVRELRPPT